MIESKYSIARHLYDWVILMIENIAADYNKGVGLKKLAKIYHKDWTTIRQLLEDAGIPLRKQQKCIDYNEASKLYKSGITLSKLSYKYHISKTSIRDGLLRNGIVLREPIYRRHQFDISNVTNYQTEECAYWFGFNLADSSLSKTRITTRLARCDISHLCKWARALGTTITPVKCWSTLHGRKFPSCRISINHHTLSQFYRTNGFCEFKCGNPYRIPIKQLLLQHLLRGLWDGDGIITHNSKYLRVGFVSPHIAIIEFVSELLSSEIGVHPNKINMHNGCYYMWWCGSSAIIIGKYLYFNQTISLNRKTNKIMQYIL